MTAEEASPERSGARVMVLEDDMLNALLIEDTLHHAGLEVVGPAITVRQAMRLAEQLPIDAAILDLQIEDEQSFEVGRKLDSLGVPWAFATGHTHDAIPPEFSHVPMLGKPFTVSKLLSLVDELLHAAPPR